MDEFIKKNKGPLIAMSSAAIGLLVLIVISALANLPQASQTESGPVNFWESIFWLILIGCLLSGIVLFVRECLAGSGTAKKAEQEKEEILTLADTPHQLAQQIEKLFGTTDMNQITTGIQAMYAELEELRIIGSDQKEVEDLAPKVKEQESIIAALTSERDQAQAAREKWQTKAIASTKEVAKLREELKDKWQLVPEEDLTAFLTTVTIKDGPDHNAFLSSKRRQRRLMQRLSVEGYSIVQKAS